MMNVGEPDSAFSLAAIPNDGIGLAREEFIFTNFIKIHPLALVNYDKIKDSKIKELIDELTVGYKDKKQYCVDKLAEGIAFIASAYSPRDVIVRLSDFKTNEYATLIGGQAYEPKEENPMIGWRGASRYYDPNYKDGFRLECLAMKKVREEWGLKNVVIMVPFCRTVEEGKKVLATMKEFGLERGKAGLRVYMMCEIPSNVILAKEFCEIFDGFSIGSNDLTQLTLGVDRDSALVKHVYDENNAAVKKLIRDVIQTAHKYGRKVGICGQAPSDYPEFAEFLVQEGIDSISLNPDTVLKTRERIASMEKKIGVVKAKFVSVAMASKMLMVLGVIGLVTVLGGYTCQTINTRNVSNDLRAGMAQELASVKAQLREELIAEIIKKVRDESWSEYRGQIGLAKFSLSYPSNWRIFQSDKQVSFTAPSGTVYFKVELIGRGDPIYNETFGGQFPQRDIRTTSTWNSFEVMRYIDTCGEYEYCSGMQIFPYGIKKNREVILLEGSADNFDSMLGKVAEFEVN